MATIDDELVKALIRPSQNGKIVSDSPIRQLVKAEILDYDTEVDFGKNRTADILLIIKKDFKQYRVVVELENDRQFDVGEILRKVKRDRLYPTIIVIPKKFEQHSYRFQKSGIPVWYWSGTCTWRCRLCNRITSSESSTTPSKCANCNKQGNYALVWQGTEKVKFEESKENPPVDFEFKSHEDISGSALRIEDLLLMPQLVGEIKGYMGKVRIINKATRIVYGVTAEINVEREGLYPRILEVKLIEGKVGTDGKPLTITRLEGYASNVEHVWADPKRTNFSRQYEKLRQDDNAILYFPETRPAVIKSFSTYPSEATFLEILPRVEHNITISIKGEDSEKNTVSARRIFRVKIKKNEKYGIYLP